MENMQQLEQLIDSKHPGLQALCEQAKKEKDPEKRNALIEEILKLFERRARS
jgi:hypothetical protein